MSRHPSTPECEHSWSYFPTLDTNPEHSTRECQKCGRRESRVGPTYLIDGGTIPATDWQADA